MATLIKQQITRYVGPDGKRCASTAPGARRIEEESAKWYGVGIPGMGTKRVPLSKDKRVSLKMLSDLIDRAERGEHGLPEKNKGPQLLDALVTEFEGAVSRKASGKHTRNVVLNVRRVLGGCKLSTVVDLLAADTTSKVERFVWGLASGDESMTTVNAAVVGKHARQFTRWLWRKRKVLDHDPLAGVDLPSQTTVNRRRALAPDEIGRLIDTISVSERSFRGLTGPDRVRLYLTASATGFRVSELAALTPAHFDLDAEVPVVRLLGPETKNKKDAEQPIPSAVAARLRPHFATLGRNDRLWPGTWWERAADMIRADLEEADIPAVTNSGEVVFHSLRHSFGTMLGRFAPVKVQQELSRHSTPVLTIGRYSHTDLEEKAAAVERLPLPGSGRTGPLSSFSRQQLEQYAESVTAILAALSGVLVTPWVTPVVDSDRDDLIRPGTNRAEGVIRTKRVKG